MPAYTLVCLGTWPARSRSRPYSGALGWSWRPVRHPAELKDMVVSPAGTTAEALRVLEERGVPAAVVAAVDAAYRKSVQLGQG